MTTANRPRKPKKRGGKRPGAGRPAMPAGEQRHVRFMVRLTSAQQRILEIRAKGAGMSVADYARLVLVGP